MTGRRSGDGRRLKNLEVGVLVVGVSEEARGGNPCIDGGSGADLENSGNSPVAAGGRGCAGCRRQWVCRLGSGKLWGSCFLASIFSVREWARPSAGCDQGNVEVKDLKKGKTETVIENRRKQRVTAWLLLESRGQGWWGLPRAGWAEGWAHSHKAARQTRMGVYDTDAGDEAGGGCQKQMSTRDLQTSEHSQVKRCWGRASAERQRWKPEAGQTWLPWGAEDVHGWSSVWECGGCRTSERFARGFGWRGLTGVHHLLRCWLTDAVPGPAQTSSTSTTWDLVRDASSWTPPQT